MPRSGPPTYTYVLPPIYLAIPGTTITAAQHNDPLEDIAATFNTVQPIVWGGTGATSAAAAIAALGGASLTSSNTFTANQTIRLSDDGASAGPLLTLDRLSATPAASDVLGEVVFSGRDSGGGTQTYGLVGAEIVDPTAASEDGRLFLQSVIAGTLATRAYVGAGVYSASAFGGDPGAGLLNFQGYNLNGVSTFSSGLLYGCTIANNALDATNDIDFSAGKCADSTNVAYMGASALTKRLDAAWAVGTDQGGLFSGAIANTTYHCFIIMRPDTGVVDAGFDTSVTAANRPAAYTLYRRIGSIVRTGGAIRPFVQDGDRFMWNVTSLPADVAQMVTKTKALTAMTLPSGIRVRGLFRLAIAVTTGSSQNENVLVYDGANANIAAEGLFFRTATTDTVISTNVEQFTNTSAQVYVEITGNPSTLNTTSVSTAGWVDTRGRL